MIETHFISHDNIRIALALCWLICRDVIYLSIISSFLFTKGFFGFHDSYFLWKFRPYDFAPLNHRTKVVKLIGP